jgi:hypothetical protein
VAYWIKFSYDRKEYIVDLDRVTGFAYEPNARITFWLPDSAYPIVVNPQAHPEIYKNLLTYIQRVTEIAFEAYWVKIDYESKQFLINLKKIGSFCYESNGRITFWLPDSTVPIVIHPATDPEGYEKIQSYIKLSTGMFLPE